jgi:hypothetical protein
MEYVCVLENGEVLGPLIFFFGVSCCPTFTGRRI